MTDKPNTGPVIYIDRSDVHEDRWEDLKAGIHGLVAFVESHQPQMATYAFYLDEDHNQMSVVSVHPDAASLERHIEVGGPEFKKLAPFLRLREHRGVRDSQRTGGRAGAAEGVNSRRRRHRSTARAVRGFRSHEYITRRVGRSASVLFVVRDLSASGLHQGSQSRVSLLRESGPPPAVW